MVSRADDFVRGRWIDLLENIHDTSRQPRPAKGETQEHERRGRAALGRVRQGQVSRARQELTGAALAPKTLETLAQLQERRPQERVREIPQEVMEFVPDRPLELDFKLFTKCLQNAPSGCAQGLEVAPTRCCERALMIQKCSSSSSGQQKIARLHLSMPETIRSAFMSASMTALQKPDGRVRGIATGTSFRRLVARTLARQFGKAVEATCAPFQFALSTRAGTDCVGHAIRAVTDANSMCTVLSIDGIGAYDHVYRSAMLAKLHEVPSLQGLLPFVRATYANPTSYVWEDEAGVQHRIIQAEGGEQGDPLMPLLFSLAIHDPLQQAQREFKADENLFAFLDDVYFTSPTPNRTRTAYDSLGEKLYAHADIQLHTGKTRVWNRSSVCPEGMVELGPEVWNPEGVKVLGTPVGSTRFVEEVVNKRLEEGAKLWEAIPTVPDLQAAWQILLQCAGPRCHMLRTLPPSQSEEYAQAHDAGMLRGWTHCWHSPATHKRLKWRTTLHPCRCGWGAWV